VIDILVPVLDRPQRALACVESAVLSAAVPFTFTFLTSPEDAFETEACKAAADHFEGVQVIEVPWLPCPGDYAKKINYGFLATSSEWVFTGADDLEFHPGWDIDCIETGETALASVVGTNDMGNPTVMRGKHSTHSLVRRAYVMDVGATFDRQPGVLLFEGYDHQYVDTELLAAAKQHGLYAHALTAKVEHLHPFWHKGLHDSTYVKALADGAADGKLYRQRERAHMAAVR